MDKKPLKLRLALYLLVLLGLVVLGGKFFGPLKVFKSTSFSFDFTNQGLSRVVKPILANNKGEYGVYIENLATGEKYGFNEYETFPAASLYKLFLLAAVMEAIDNKRSLRPDGLGQLTIDNEITASKGYLTDQFGAVDFGYEDADDQISYTVDEAMQRIGRISDNFASIMLADKVGWDKLQEMADKLGAKNTSIKDPFSTSASDIGLFFKKLYNGEVVSKDGSNKIIGYLSLSKINNRIPAGVPVGVKVIHKTGELPQVRHDAGIVYLEGNPYIIVIMAKDVIYEDDAVSLEADLSKSVYDYFSSK